MKRNEIIVYEHKKGVKAVKYNQKPQTTIEPSKPRNPVAKNANAAIGGGAAGAHKDKKKAAKQGDVKHKSKALDMAEATKKPNATTRHLRDYPVSDKDVAKPVKKPEKKKPEQGVAEGSLETDNMVSHIGQVIQSIYPRGGDKNTYMKLVAREMPRIVKANPKLFRRAFGMAYDRFFHIDQDDDFDYTDYSMRQGEKGVAEMDSQGYTGTRDDYNLGGPEGTGKAMKAKEFAKAALNILNKHEDDDGEEWYDRNGRPNPNGAYDAAGHYHLDRDIDEMYGRKSNYYNPMDYERDQQRQMDYDRREFKRQELQHELGHEDDPNFERNFRQQQMDRDRGPWYLKVNGKILKVKGEPKVFDWKNGATKYGQAILKNKPELNGKIMLTKKSVDDVAEGEGKVTASDPAKGVEITNPETGVKTTLPPKMSSALAPDPQNPNRYTLNPKAVAPGDSQDSETGPKVGSEVNVPDQATEEDMMMAPGDSRSPIHGDEDHDEISKLLIMKLRRLAGL